MLFAVRPGSFDVIRQTDFELDFTPLSKGKIDVSVFVRNFKDRRAYKRFVGKVSPKDAILACGLPDSFASQLSGVDAKPASVYRNDLALSWANRAQDKLKYDTVRNSAIVLLAEFKESVAVSSKAMKRKPRFFGGFGLVELRSGELLRLDGRYLIYTGSTLRMPFELEIREDDLVDCTGILNRGTILAPAITLF